MRDPASRFSARLVFGLIVLVFGVVLLLSKLHLLDLNHALRFAPLALVLMALQKFWNRGFLRASNGHALLAGAALLQLACLDRMDLVEKWWPLALVWVGLALTVKALMPHQSKRDDGDATASEAPFCQDSREDQP